MNEFEVIEMTMKYVVIEFIVISLIVIGLLALFNIKTRNFFGWMSFSFLVAAILIFLLNIFKNELLKFVPLDQAATITLLLVPILKTAKTVAYVYAGLAFLFFLLFIIRKKRA